MTDSVASEKVADAAETVAAAEVAQATAAVAEAEAIVEEKQAQAAALTTAAAQAATGLAAANAAETQAKAADTINEAKGDLSWLKQHAEATAGSLGNLAERQGKTESQLSQIQEALGQAMTALRSLTPQKSMEQTTVNPEKESKKQDGQEAGQKAAEKPKRQKRWI